MVYSRLFTSFYIKLFYGTIDITSFKIKLVTRESHKNCIAFVIVCNNCHYLFKVSSKSRDILGILCERF